jgi:fructokinase
MNHQNKCILFGEILWDCFGENKLLGGAPLNFAYYSSAYSDNQVYLISSVGKDEDGKKALQIIKKTSIKTDYIHEIDHPTGMVTVQMNPDQSHEFIIHENRAWDHISLSDKEMDQLSGAELLYFGTLSQRSKHNQRLLQRIVDRNPEAFVVFDLNLRGDYYSKEIIEQCLAKSSLFKLNETEWEIIKKLLSLPLKDQEAYNSIFANFNLWYLCITLGDKGSLLIDRSGNTLKADPVKVKVVDTVGCGDAFAAKLANELIRQTPAEQALSRATELAAKVAQNKGAMLPLI